jgi:hypothetical protein
MLHVDELFGSAFVAQTPALGSSAELFVLSPTILDPEGMNPRSAISGVRQVDDVDRLFFDPRVVADYRHMNNTVIWATDYH